MCCDLEDRTMKRIVVTAYAGAAAAVAATLPLGAQQSQPAAAADPATPSLANIMATIQFRHLKLAYSGRVTNWPLAGYELDLIQQSFDTAARLYPVFKGVPVAELIKQESAPPIADLRRAIDAKSSDGSAKAFVRLTEACNGCHRAAGVGFIVIRTPAASPFSNQVFPPTEAR
jgi:hypothetical protein